MISVSNPLQTIPIGVRPGPIVPDDWTEDAACAGKAELMDAEPFTAESEQAKDLCMQCPVVAMCRAAGAGEEFGIWAGEHKEERCPRGTHDYSQNRQTFKHRGGLATRCRACKREDDQLAYQRKKHKMDKAA